MTSEHPRHFGGITMGWFGPSKDEVWRQLSEEIGAEFVEGGMWNENKVQVHAKPWTITLDTYIVSGVGNHVYTRLRAPYINPEGFRFTIYRMGFCDHPFGGGESFSNHRISITRRQKGEARKAGIFHGVPNDPKPGVYATRPTCLVIEIIIRAFHQPPLC
jgi:hypothetical protein